VHEPGVTHVLVTGGAGYIGSHAALRLLTDSYRVTIVVNFKNTEPCHMYFIFHTIIYFFNLTKYVTNFQG
jgi:UDP-glucose 4-epimerase